MIIAKFSEKSGSGKIVQIVRVAETVGFSSECGWIFICFDFERSKRTQHSFKWVKASEAKFEWVREFVE
jgi:hypothetical protein